MAHGFMYYRWSCEEGPFKYDLDFERVILTTFCYLGAGKVGGNEKEKQKTNDRYISRSTNFYSNTRFLKNACDLYPNEYK